MKKLPLATVALLATLSIAALAGCSAQAAPAGGAAAAAPPAGVTVLPVAADPIKNTSTTPGLTIVSAAAENNVDASGAALTDRLQVTIGNTTDKPLTSLEMYYVETDKTTGKSEGYYQALTGLTLAAKSQTTINFDNGTAPGHYPENQFSLYRSSPNQVDFTIEVSAAGVQVARGTATKSAGTGEAVGG